jgi:hypothetical protein
MKFVLVNGRMPRPQVRCVKCDQPIEANYLREIGTHLTYCNHNCYADQCDLLNDYPIRPSETSPQSKKRTLR